MNNITLWKLAGPPLLIAGVTVAALSAGSVTAGAENAHGNHQAEAGVHQSDPPPQPASGAYPPYGPVPDDMAKGLTGLSVEMTDAPSITVGVSLEDAADVARANMGLTDVPADQMTATIQQVTTNGYGLELEPDPSKPSNIVPAIDHQSVWVITFAHAQVPVFGRTKDSPTTTTADVVVFVGAEKPDFLYSLAF
jgi:hypothetical protein